MRLAIETDNIVKHYGRLKALDHVSINVAEGEIFGFLGPNGAGKTTFVKILLNLVGATEGSARIFGEDISSVRSRREVGFLPEHISMYGFMTIAEYLTMHARLADVPGRSIPSEIENVLNKVGLSQDRNHRLATLSKGMQQRAGIAQAMIGRPRLLFFDEPTSGLDPIWVRDLRTIMLELKEQGATIFLNSHLLSEVERTCDRIAILNKGKIIRSGTRDEMSDRERHLELVVEGFGEIMMHEINMLCQRPLEIDGSILKIFPRDGKDLLLIHRIIDEHGGRLQSLCWKGESLEELFYRLVKHENSDNS